MLIIFVILFLFFMLFYYCENYENTKKILKLKFGSKFYLPENPIKRHQMQNIDQFIKYFLPSNYNYIVVNDNEKSDITIWDIYMDNNDHLRDDEINILICVENVDHWNQYQHYTKYNNYNDNKICNCHYNLNDDLNENITIEITNDFNIRLLFKLLIFTSILSNYMHTIIYIMNNY